MNDFFYLKIVDPNPVKIKMKINISLILSFYNYCIDQIEMINRIVKSKAATIEVRSIHDIVPTIIKSGKYYSLLKKLKFIRCAKRRNILNQILEVNYILYKKYFIFHEKHIAEGFRIIQSFKNFTTVGIHVRLKDECLKSCNINSTDVNKISNLSKRLCRGKCLIILSSFYKNFSQFFSRYIKNVYVYNLNFDVKHSQKSKAFGKEDIKKIILDIYLVSNSNILILSRSSTFSLLILYKGYYKSYEKCIPKSYSFWNNIYYFDHLEHFRRKSNCKNISI